MPGNWTHSTLPLADEVEPALQNGKIVVSDRYIPSSLVYRKLDGIPFQETWRENASFRIPHLSILLHAPPATLEARLRSKNRLSRFEREHTSGEESKLYEDAYSFLREKGYRIAAVSNDANVDLAAEKIIHMILE